MLHLGVVCFSGTPEDCCRDFAWMVYLECLQWSATFLLVEARRKEQDLSTFLMSWWVISTFTPHFSIMLPEQVEQVGLSENRLNPIVQASDKVVPVLGKNRCALGKCVSQKSCL